MKRHLEKYSPYRLFRSCCVLAYEWTQFLYRSCMHLDVQWLAEIVDYNINVQNDKFNENFQSYKTILS